jgi:hypothetical protein
LLPPLSIQEKYSRIHQAVKYHNIFLFRSQICNRLMVKIIYDFNLDILLR